MEVMHSVRFPKIFSPRVLIRDSNRVNEFDSQSHGWEPSGLNLSLHSYENPIKSQRQSAFSRHIKYDSEFRDSSLSDYDSSLHSPSSASGLSPRTEHDLRYGSSLSPGTNHRESFKVFSVPSWHWNHEGPHDLSTQRGQPSPGGWEMREAPSPSSVDPKKTLTDPRSYGSRFSKAKVKVFKCPYCVITCSNRGQLLGHIRIHTGERPFVCQESGCKKAFIRNEELTRHRRIHTGERPYVCDSCKKAFTRKDHLNKHMKIHSNTDEIFSV